MSRLPSALLPVTVERLDNLETMAEQLVTLGQILVELPDQVRELRRELEQWPYGNHMEAYEPLRSAAGPVAMAAGDGMLRDLSGLLQTVPVMGNLPGMWDAACRALGAFWTEHPPDYLNQVLDAAGDLQVVRVEIMARALSEFAPALLLTPEGRAVRDLVTSYWSPSTTDVRSYLVLLSAIEQGPEVVRAWAAGAM